MYDIIIIGGGSAGLAAALAAHKRGIQNLLLVEREYTLGGTEADRKAFECAGIPCRLLTIARRMTTAKSVTLEDREHGRYVLEARAIILATGGRALPDASLPVPDRTLCDGAHLLIDPATGGAVVDQHRQSEIAGIFVCGNALHPHEGAKTAAKEGEIAGKGAVDYILGKHPRKKSLRLMTVGGLSYAIPQCITALSPVTLYLRPSTHVRVGRVLVRDGDNILWDRIESDLTPDRLLTILLTSTALRTVRAEALTACIEVLE